MAKKNETKLVKVRLIKSVQLIAEEGGLRLPGELLELKPELAQTVVEAGHAEYCEGSAEPEAVPVAEPEQASLVEPAPEAETSTPSEGGDKA